ncbi:MAG: sialidase family protein [Steroidobacteraceae bacterium]
MGHSRFACLLTCLGLACWSICEASVAVTDGTRRAQAPEVAVGSDGSIHVIWLDKGPAGMADRKGSDKSGGHSHQSYTDLMYARSDDGGKSFSPAVRVNPREGEVWGFSVAKPSIGVGPGGVIHVAYPANATSPLTGKAVASSLYVRSLDGGKTFSEPLQMNADVPGDLSELVHGGLSQAQVFGTMAVSAQGDVYAFWLDTRDMTPEHTLSSTYMRASHDNGASFEMERMLYQADACPCCQLTALADSAGRVLLGSRMVGEENLRSPTVAVSTDRGASFGSRVAAEGTPWKLDGCPLKPTALAAQGNVLHTLVHNGAETPPGLLYSRSIDGGRSFEPAIRIHPDAAVSDSPSLAASAGTLYAFWHAKADGVRRIFSRRSIDDGASWGPVVELEAPEGTGSYPEAAALPDGRAVVVWQQGEQVFAALVGAP